MQLQLLPLHNSMCLYNVSHIKIILKESIARTGAANGQTSDRGSVPACVAGPSACIVDMKNSLLSPGILVCF